MVEISVIIPVYNEEASITPLYLSLKRVMNSLSTPYEIIFINDASNDRTFDVLQGINNGSTDLVVINLESHGGKSIAMQAGFDHAQGNVIVTMDGDGQNDPEDIVRLLKKMSEGYDVVCGWRRLRHDPWGKKIASQLANVLRRVFFQENVHDVGCFLRVYTARSIKKLNLHGQRHRFLTALLKKAGMRIAEVEVKHHPRYFGKSKYGTMARFFSSIPDFFMILLEDPVNERESISSNMRKYESTK